HADACRALPARGPRRGDRLMVTARGRRPAALRPRTAGRYVLALAYAAFVLLPIVYMVLVSLQDAVTAGDGVAPPPGPWQTFVEMWRTVDLGTYLRNSMIIAVLTGVCASVLALGAGYVVARFRFRFRNAFRISLLATNTVPGVLLLLPLFVVYVIVQHALQ